MLQKGLARQAWTPLYEEVGLNIFYTRSQKKSYLQPYACQLNMNTLTKQLN